MRILVACMLFGTLIISQAFGQKFTDASGNEMQNPFLKYDKFVGSKFPADQLERLEGGSTTIKKYAGKPILINFWFTSCPPCIEELPALNRLKAKYKGKVNFISITFNDKQKVEKLFKKRQFDFDNYVNARKLIDKFGVDTYPLSFFVDKKGIIKSISGPIPVNNKGENDEAFFEPMLQKML